MWGKSWQVGGFARADVDNPDLSTWRDSVIRLTVGLAPRVYMIYMYVAGKVRLTLITVETDSRPN